MKVLNLMFDGVQATQEQASALAKLIVSTMADNGYMTACRVEVLAKSISFAIAENGKCFTVDTDALGHNCKVNNTPIGYKRCNFPTWDQRVDFNNILNGVLDQLGASARIHSKAFVVRTAQGALTESDWFKASNGDIGAVIPLTNAMVLEGKENLKKLKAAQKALEEASRPDPDGPKGGGRKPKVTLSDKSIAVLKADIISNVSSSHGAQAKRKAAPRKVPKVTVMQRIKALMAKVS